MSGQTKTMERDDMDGLLQQNQSSDRMPPGLEPFELRDLSGAPASTDQATPDLWGDVELDLRIELGRTHLCSQEVLQLRQGSVVPLDKLAGEPVDIYVNERLVGRGEVLVLNDNFCVRVADLITRDAMHC